MKLLVLIFSLTFLQAQIEFAPPGAIWHQNAVANDLGAPTWHPLKDFFTIEYTGDTVIQGDDYKIIGDNYLRQEGDSIFHWLEGSPRLIYDFGAQVGDTVTFEFITCCGTFGVPDAFTFEVIQADEIVVDGQSLRRVVCQPIDNCYDLNYEYIEKIGSTLRLVDSYLGCVALPEFRADWLRCYSDAQIEYRTEEFLSYGGDTLACDYTPPPNSINEVEQVRVFISPNPATDFIQLSSGQELTGPASIELYNLTGLLVRRERIILGVDNQVFVGDQAAGIYFVRVKADNGRYGVTKVMKR